MREDIRSHAFKLVVRYLDQSHASFQQLLAERDRHERRIDDGQIAINRTNDRHQVKYVADATPVRQGDGQKLVDAATEQGTELLNASIIRPIAAAAAIVRSSNQATSPPSNRPGGWIQPRIGSQASATPLPARLVHPRVATCSCCKG